MTTTDSASPVLGVMASALQVLEAELAARGAGRFYGYYPDDGPCARHLYATHLAFFRAGREHAERVFLGANRCGKTTCAGWEIACHLTGEYPTWWEGRVFDGPTRWWAAGETRETTRDIVQLALVGPPEVWGAGLTPTGLIPGHLVTHVARKPGGVLNCVDTVWVRHRSGGTSSLSFRSYDQGREAFQGTKLSGVWLDEEPPETEDLYTECLLRTMATGPGESNGLVLSTFTPLRGLTRFLQQYLESAVTLTPSGQLRPARTMISPEHTLRKEQDDEDSH